MKKEMQSGEVHIEMRLDILLYASSLILTAHKDDIKDSKENLNYGDSRLICENKNAWMDSKRKNITMRQETIDVYNEFKYLGITLCNKRYKQQHFNNKIKMRRTIRMLNPVLWSSEISKKAK